MATIPLERHLEDLMAFHQVATAGSFTKAAQAQGSSKAHLSRQVRRLETLLRAQLLRRTTRTLHLTEAGTALLTYSHRLADLAGEAGHAARNLRRDLEGAIKISMPVSFGEFFGPSFLPIARKAMPEVKFELDLANENRDFLKHEVDFALRATTDHHPDLIARHLGRLKDVVCAAPSLAGIYNKFTDPRELADWPCILHSQEEKWNTWTLSSQKRDVRIKIQGAIATNQYPTAQALCRAGLGFARLPYYMAKEDIASGKLVRLFSEYEISTHPLYLVHLKSEYAAKRVTLTREKILEWFKGQSEIFL